MLDITLRDIDKRIWEQELADFVPNRIYDVHTHVYDWRMDSQEVRNFSEPPKGIWADYPVSNWEMLEQADKCLLPGCNVHRFLIGNPLQDCNVEQANLFTASQSKFDSDSVAFMLVRPDILPETLSAQIEQYAFVGFKPYRLHSITGDTVECRIIDFLPEYQIEVADKFGLMIMLHLSKSKSIADKDNLSDLDFLTNKYPNVKWILAHCARSYYDIPLLQAKDVLSRLPNIWYDISSVCDSDAMETLLNIAGPTRVMYGSDDLPVGIMRGKYITFGYAWAELNENNHNLNLSHCLADMTFVRYESLRAFRRACRRCGYGASEVDKLFFKNAEQLVKSYVIRKEHK